MFSLAYELTDEIEIQGESYTLDMSFDNIIRLIDLIGDEELDDGIKVEEGLDMLLDRPIETDLATKTKIFYQIFEKAVAQQELKPALDRQGNPMPDSDTAKGKVYSLSQDAEYIYASFMQDYGIDLIEQQGKLHWNKFKALLSGLRNDTKLKEVVQIRTCDLPSGKGTAKERERMKKLKKEYALEKED
ncbi:bacteriophage Gp15 family protein [Bacillus sp. JCM 19041]|uniref:bacteriophage Gp15 family protein n=1 Tax=Bacillus sp. JCM 19041 TaxID=1460637 RepID=UPI0006D1601C